MTITDFLAKHPVDRERVEAHKRRMLAEVESFSPETASANT